MQLEHGIFFDQHWASLRKVMPVASGGIHAGQMHQLLRFVRRRRACCNSAAARSAIRWASRPARQPTASRWRRWSSRATKAATSWTKGQEILERGGEDCLPLRQALDIWKDVTFNYTSTDTPDFVPTATAVHKHLTDRRYEDARDPGLLFVFAGSDRRSDPHAGAILHRQRLGGEHRISPTIRIRGTPIGRCGDSRCSTSGTRRR